MSHEDCQMYWLRTGDTWTKIDYSKKAEEWMKPLVKGQETGLVEIPGSWLIRSHSFALAVYADNLKVHRRPSSDDVHKE